METFSALLALLRGIHRSLVDSPPQRPVMRSFGAFVWSASEQMVDKQSRRRWFVTPSRSLWRHCNDTHIPWLVQYIFKCHTVYIIVLYVPFSGVRLTWDSIYKPQNSQFRRVIFFLKPYRFSLKKLLSVRYVYTCSKTFFKNFGQGRKAWNWSIVIWKVWISFLEQRGYFANFRFSGIYVCIAIGLW